MRHLPEGGFQTRPYESRFLFAPFAFFAANFFIAFRSWFAVGVMDFALRQWQTSHHYKS